MWRRMGRAFGIGMAVVAGAAFGMVSPRAAAAVPPIEIDLGTHVFGHLSVPSSAVVHAGPGEVGFQPPGDGDIFGPWSFQIGVDGTVWLLDEVNNRLLSWRAGTPGPTVPVGPPGVWDFAVAPDGSVYYTTTLRGLVLHAVSPDGRERWRTALSDNGAVRVGPDGTVYVVGYGTGRWTPVSTVDGQPLPVADQVRLTRADQPLPGNGSLLVTWAAPHRVDIALRDATGATVRAWRVTSTTAIDSAGFVPTVVGGDPVIGLEAYDSSRAELMVLALTPTGAGPPVVLRRHTYGAPVTDLRAGPDAAVYQLTTDPATGATVSRFPLPAPVPVPASPSAVPASSAPVAVPSPVPGRHGTPGWLWLALGGLVFAAAVAVGPAIVLIRRRNRAAAPR